MKIHTDIEQGTNKWHGLRLGRITGSMFGVAKGNGQGCKDYMDDLIEERRSGKPRENHVNAHMQRGTDMEPFARAEYEKQYRVKVQEVGFVEFNEDIGVSPDGLVGDSGVIEIKCPTLDNHNKTTGVPSQYKAQIQGTLWVTGRKWLDFISYHPDAELFVIRVYPDEAYIKELKIRIYMFIADMKAMITKTEDSRKDSTMQHTGNITAIQPTQQGGYQSSNGWIFTYTMTVNTQAGPITGEIGSKSQPYPKNPGEQITVEVTSDQQHGNKFKNINPQFAGQNQQAPQQQTPQGQGFQQQGQQPAQQQGYTPPPQNAPRDVQDEIRFAQALNLACQDVCHDKISEPGIHERVRTYYQILKTRQFPADMSSTSNVLNTPPEADNKPLGNDNQDDIPF